MGGPWRLHELVRAVDHGVHGGDQRSLQRLSLRGEGREYERDSPDVNGLQDQLSHDINWRLASKRVRAPVKLHLCDRGSTKVARKHIPRQMGFLMVTQF